MADALTLRPPPAGFVLDTRPPGSKSLTNRALLLAAMAPGQSELTGCLDAEDTRIMAACLARLGVTMERAGDRIRIHGTGWPLGTGTGHPVELDVGTAGTVARFLTAALAGGPVEVVLDGSPRMRERPMAELVTALREQGAHLDCLVREGFLPIRIHPSKGLRGGEISLGELTSSQFPSALIYAALAARKPTRLILAQGTPARPYVDMTVATVQAFGGNAHWVSANTVTVEPGPLVARAYDVEPDASSASYLLAAAAIFGGHTTIRDLGRTSLQGDARFVDILTSMGAETEQTDTRTRARGTGSIRGIEVDLSDMPDMTLTLAVAALHAETPTIIRGVSILRHHESDRLAAAASELRKFGCHVDILPDGLHLRPAAGGPWTGATVQTYRDHRMAMAFSLAGHVTIEDPGCVGKTFPGYFTTLAEIGMVEPG